MLAPKRFPPPEEPAGVAAPPNPPVPNPLVPNSSSSKWAEECAGVFETVGSQEALD